MRNQRTRIGFTLLGMVLKEGSMVKKKSFGAQMKQTIQSIGRTLYLSALFLAPFRVLPRQVCRGTLIVLMSALWASCIVIPAKSNVAQSWAIQAPSGEIALSVLISRDFSPETPKNLGEEIVECITHSITEAASEVRLVPEEEFYRAVFGAKPGEVLLREDTIRTLLARPDIAQRVGESGLTYVVLVGGLTSHHSGDHFFAGGGGPGAAYVAGWADVKRSTRLTAFIFDLTGGAEVGRVEASAEGRQGVAIVLPLVLGWVHATESASCEALGEKVAHAIHGRSGDESR